MFKRLLHDEDQQNIYNPEEEPEPDVQALEQRIMTKTELKKANRARLGAQLSKQLGIETAPRLPRKNRWKWVLKERSKK